MKNAIKQLNVLELCRALPAVVASTLLSQSGVCSVSRTSLVSSTPTGIDTLKNTISDEEILISAKKSQVILTDLNESELKDLGCHPSQLTNPVLYVRLVPSLCDPSITDFEAVGPAVGEDHDAFIGDFAYCAIANTAILTAGQVASFILFTAKNDSRKGPEVHTVAADEIALQATTVVECPYNEMEAFLTGKTKTPYPEPFVWYFRLFVDSYECSDGRWVLVCAMSPIIVARIFDMLDIKGINLGESFNLKRMEELLAILTKAFLTKPSHEWEKELQEANIACITDTTVEEIKSGTRYEGVTIVKDGVLAPLINLRDVQPETGDQESFTPLSPEYIERLHELGGTRRGPLSGKIVVDMTHTVAGPFCGRSLAEYGATVIKVDKLGTNYIFRPEDMLRDKLTIKLNLKTKEGLQFFGSLLASADFFVESGRPDVIDKLGFSEARLRRINPDLILLRTKLHDEGVLKSYVGYAPVGMAVSGQTILHQKLNNFPRPFCHYWQSVDVACGQILTVSAGAAHYLRSTGQGIRYATSALLRAAALCIVDQYLPDTSVYRTPTELLRCSDGALLVGGVNAKAVVEEFSSGKTKLTVEEARATTLSKEGIKFSQPCAKTHARVGEPYMLANGVRFLSATENVSNVMPLTRAWNTKVPSMAPVPGSHTAEILSQSLGVDVAQFPSLTKDKVIDLKDRQAITFLFPQ